MFESKTTDTLDVSVFYEILATPLSSLFRWNLHSTYYPTYTYILFTFHYCVYTINRLNVDAVRSRFYVLSFVFLVTNNKPLNICFVSFIVNICMHKRTHRLIVVQLSLWLLVYWKENLPIDSQMTMIVVCRLLVTSKRNECRRAPKTNAKRRNWY